MNDKYFESLWYDLVPDSLQFDEKMSCRKLSESVNFTIHLEFLVAYQ